MASTFNNNEQTRLQNETSTTSVLSQYLIIPHVYSDSSIACQELFLAPYRKLHFLSKRTSGWFDKLASKNILDSIFSRSQQEVKIRHVEAVSTQHDG